MWFVNLVIFGTIVAAVIDAGLTGLADLSVFAVACAIIVLMGLYGWIGGS